jgi:hypothetical protein
MAIPAVASAQPGILSAPTPSFSPTNVVVLADATRTLGAHDWQQARSDWLAQGAAGGSASRRPRSVTAQLEAAPTQAGPPAGPARAAPSGKADWYAIAACESGGRWNLNSGNGFWGGLQFLPSTWFAYGGGAFNGVGPFPYSAGEQIAVAERVLAGQGPNAWPNCFRWA